MDAQIFPDGQKSLLSFPKMEIIWKLRQEIENSARYSQEQEEYFIRTAKAKLERPAAGFSEKTAGRTPALWCLTDETLCNSYETDPVFPV